MQILKKSVSADKDAITELSFIVLGSCIIKEVDKE